MNLRRTPSNPVYPTTNWNMEATQIAPCTSRILSYQHALPHNLLVPLYLPQLSSLILVYLSPGHIIIHGRAIPGPLVESEDGEGGSDEGECPALDDWKPAANDSLKESDNSRDEKYGGNDVPSGRIIISEMFRLTPVRLRLYHLLKYLMQRAGHRMKGMERTPPIMVRKCWKPRKRHMYHGGTSSIL